MMICLQPPCARYIRHVVQRLHTCKRPLLSPNLYNIMSDRKATGYQEAAKLVAENTIPEDALVIDCRSDTVTKPDQEMRLAIMNAEVGDDVYREDPTIKELQRKTAEVLGKEAALFVPSGTMSNLIALLCHCGSRGSEAIVGDESHILHYEQAGASQFGGINLRTVKTLPDGTLDLDEIKAKMRFDDIHQAVTQLICLENTHNRCGGRIVPLEWTRKVSDFAKEQNVKLHLDGARIFNAAVALGVPVAEVAEPFDSVSVCLSKGLGAPVGSLIVGSHEFVERALRCRKALGGGMRQAGILAAAGLLALEKGPLRMVDDHKFTRRIAQAACEAGRGLVTVDMDTVETNMVMVKVQPGSGLTTVGLVKRLSVSTAEETAALGKEVRFLAYPMTKVNVRIVIHCNLTEEMIQMAEKKIRYVLDEHRKQN